jgi:hypothetical protein
MAMRIERAVVDKQFGGIEGLTQAISEFRDALVAHAQSEDVAAPRAHPLVEQVVLYQGGEFEVTDTALDPAAEGSEARWVVRKATIIRRLDAAGGLATARAALDASPLLLRELWNAQVAFYADDEQVVAFLASIGADAATILAP